MVLSGNPHVISFSGGIGPMPTEPASISTFPNVFLQAWQDDPHDLSIPLIMADHMEDQGMAGDAKLVREIIRAFRMTKPSRKTPEFVSWYEMIERLPQPVLFFYAFGCVARCSLWCKEFSISDLILDLSRPPDSEGTFIEYLRDLSHTKYMTSCHEVAIKARINMLRIRGRYETDHFGRIMDVAWCCGDTIRSRAILAGYGLRWTPTQNKERRWQSAWLLSMVEVFGVKSENP